MSNMSYIVETNGENGVNLYYNLLDYTPQEVVWDSENTIPEGSDLPDAELPVSPEYVRRMENEEYKCYRRTIFMPSKSETFSLYPLVDGTLAGYTYEQYSSFLTVSRQGEALLVKSSTNVFGGNRNGTISILFNIGGENLFVPIVQDYQPVRITLLSYSYENIDMDDSGRIDDIIFEHTFHWLTAKTSPNKEALKIEVLSTGPRNSYIISDVSKYVYVGELNESYVVSGVENYYQTEQLCEGDNVYMGLERVIFNPLTEGVYKKIEYNSDLKIDKNGSILSIINYGRCFLQDDAYYVITLSNVDDLDETASIVIKYQDEEP